MPTQARQNVIAFRADKKLEARLKLFAERNDMTLGQASRLLIERALGAPEKDIVVSQLAFDVSRRLTKATNRIVARIVELAKEELR